MTEINESSDRLTRLERLMEQQILNTAELTQQIKEISIQIKAQATFHDRFEQELSATKQLFSQELSTTKQLIESNAKAIAANSTSIDSERKAIKELRRSIRESRFENLDRHRDTLDRNNALYEAIEDLQDDIKEIHRKLDRQNPPE